MAAPESGVLAALVLGATLAQLSSATVRIDLAKGSVAVEAIYRFESRPDSGVSAVLIRLPGQVLELLEIAGGQVEQLEGLIRIRAMVDSTGALPIRFRVAGDWARIPIPVPSLATDGRSKAVEVRIGGESGLANLSEAFPRFTREGDGTAVARLASVPSVVQLPARARWPVLRLLDWGVIALAIGSLLGWAMHSRAAGARS